jgi:hypothetical protein
MVTLGDSHIVRQGLCPKATAVGSAIMAGRVSRALYTSPIPPAPSVASISYGPSRVPGLQCHGGLRFYSHAGAGVLVAHTAQCDNRLRKGAPQPYVGFRSCNARKGQTVRTCRQTATIPGVRMWEGVNPLGGLAAPASGTTTIPAHARLWGSILAAIASHPPPLTPPSRRAHRRQLNSKHQQNRGAAVDRLLHRSGR